jgi:hypothetical protein
VTKNNSFLGYRDDHGNEMHCARLTCSSAECGHGCIRPAALYRIEYDGFVGIEVGSYTTREGKDGVVLQQIGTKVVHVYSRKWLNVRAAS